MDLRRAIGDALGLAGPFPDAPGWKHFDLLAGALDPITRAVAWVEDRQDPRPDDPRPGWVECQVELRAARDGRELVTWPLHHYNPYFGTKVFHLHVEDEQAIVVYDEKHRTYVAVVPFNGRPRFQALGRFAAHLILPDRILFVHYERQWSLGGFTLPELEPCRTVPIAIDGQANALSTRAVLRIEDDTVVVPLANGREARAPVSLRPEIGPQRG
ncbi:MAG TPA: hypothetical protein VFF73_36260 [Planctomycetota bacterium]|nr:hypothetical protein [Planctomycetota bacterium]